MMAIFGTLYARLALVLFVLFCLIGGAFLAAVMYSAQLYQQEVSQRLNRDLAAHIVDEHVLMENGALNQEGLEALFHDLMIINPSLEFYLLDPGGRILSYSAAPGKMKRQGVDLAPLRTVLDGRQRLPVLGDDPRSEQGKKAFSVAPVISAGEHQGYIYAILGSEQADTVAELLRNSYILRWSALVISAALLVALLTGLLVFAVMTRRLRALSQRMEAFRRRDFSAPVEAPAALHPGCDEIDRLDSGFHAMARHIQAQMERLRASDDLRRELVANVSHDLRTPLASLQGYLETLIVKDHTLSEDDRRLYLETAQRHAQLLAKLVMELFELAKLDAREIKPNLEPFPLAELVQDVTQKFQLPAREQGVEIRVDATPDMQLAEADIGMIERVLDNLIDNALRHTPSGGTIRLSVSSADGLIRVRVRDSGSGIPASELPYIFERFYHKTSGEARHGGGAGLGLAIAQRIVELHGSRISVKSAVNRGSEFGFTLPACPAAVA